MKLKVNNVEVLELNETKKKVIKNDIHADAFDAEIQRRVRWIVEDKYSRCFDRLKREWEPRLADKGIQSVPLDPDAFAELVFSQADYKDRKTKDLEQVLQNSQIIQQ